MENPFEKVWQLVFNASHSRTFSLLALLLIILAVPLTVLIAQKQQELRQRAEGLTCEVHRLDVALSALPNTTKLNKETGVATIKYSIRENVNPANITHLDDVVSPLEGVVCTPNDAKSGSCTVSIGGQYEWKHKWKFCDGPNNCTPECITTETVTVKGFEIHGTVFEDKNANGDFDQTGTAPERWKGGVPITISGPVTKTTTTPANSGQYYFYDLPKGVYTVGIDLSSQDLRGYEITTRNGASQTIDPSTVDIADVSWGIKQTAQQTLTINGTVWVDSNENQAKDFIETGKENVSITLNGNNINRTRITNTAGHYFFRDLTPGTYTVTIAIPQGFRITTGDARSLSITLTGDVETTDASWGIKEIATSRKFNVSGVVFIDTNSDGEKQTNEAAVTNEANGAKVQIIDTRALLPTDYVKEKSVTSGGQYSFENLVEETYDIRLINLPSGIIATGGILGIKTINSTIAQNPVNLGVIQQATSENREPLGFIDRANCTTNKIYGWTCDPDNFNTSISVNIFEGTRKLGSVIANTQREQGVGQQCGGNVFHGFEFDMPASLKTDTHNVSATAINTPPGLNKNLGLLNVDCGAPTATPDPTKRYSADINVYVDTNGDGFFDDTNERGYPNAILKGKGIAFGRIIESKTLVTDTNGYTTVANLQSGDYWLELTVPSGYKVTTGSNPVRGFLSDDNAPPPGRNVTINFGITLVNPSVPTYSISGVAFIDNNGNGIQDNNPSQNNVDRGYSATTIKLCIKDPPTSQGRGCAFFPSFYDDMRATNGEGFYSFDSLSAGTYKLQVDVPIGWELTTGNSPTGDLVLPFTAANNPNKPNRVINFGLKPPPDATDVPTKPIGRITITIPPTSTRIPTRTPTITRAATITSSATTTLTSTRTPTTTTGQDVAKLALYLKFNSIGNNTANSENPNPKTPTRQVRVEIFDNTNTKKAESTGNVTYDQASGLFKGIIDVSNLASGNYSVKVKSNKFLRRLIGKETNQPIQPINTGQTPNQTPESSLIVGDINNDNNLDILDYNEYLSCFGRRAGTESCPSPEKIDLNDDGQTDNPQDMRDQKWLFESFRVQKGD